MTISTKARKFKTYNSLLQALRRGGIENAGIVSTLLLECFIEDGGRIQASKVVSRGVCVEGCFSEWRDSMVKSGWLAWSYAQTDKGMYHAGKKLVPYINKEKLTVKEIVTRDEVISKGEAPSMEEFEVLKNKVARIEASMKEIYETLDLGELDPPDFPKLKIKTTSATSIL